MLILVNHVCPLLLVDTHDSWNIISSTSHRQKESLLAGYLDIAL